MLAPKTTTADDFARILRLPDRPSSIDRADDVHRQAVAALEAAQQRHVEAVRLYKSQQPGQPISLTQADVDEMARPLQALKDAGEVAKGACVDARAAHQTDVNQALARPLADYSNAVGAALNHLEHLLTVGAQLHSVSVLRKVDLPSRLPGKCVAIAGLISMQRKLFNAAT